MVLPAYSGPVERLANSVIASADFNNHSAGIDLALNSPVVDLGNPTFGLPTPGSAAQTALTAAITATPVGGTLDGGNRSITLTAQVTLTKRITIQNLEIIASGVRPLLVSVTPGTFVGAIFNNVTITRTGATGASGSGMTLNCTKVQLNNCTITSASGSGLEASSGTCNGLRVTGGYFSSGHTGGAEAFVVQSGAQNDDIKITGATIRHTGYGTGLTLYSSSNFLIDRCDVQGIRASPWYDRGSGTWTVFSGSVWRTPERTDGVQSNSVWVGADSGTWATTKVEYLEGSSTALAAGQYLSNGDGFLYIRLTDSTDPNAKFTRTRRTNGYGILAYSTASAVAGIQNGTISRNYVKDCDGFGIYWKAGQGVPSGNRSMHNTIEDCCLLGIAVSSLPFAGYGVLAAETLTMIGDTIKRSGTTAFPVPNVKFLHDDTNGIMPKITITDVWSAAATGSGFVISKGYFKFKGCTSTGNALSGYASGSQVAGDCYVRLLDCDALDNGTLTASNGVNLSGTTTTMRVTIRGGRFAGNSLRGIQLTSCIDSRVSPDVCEGNTQQGVNIATCTRIRLDAPSSVGDDDIVVDSGTTGLTFDPGTEDTGTTITISCTNWRVGYLRYMGVGSPESVLAAPISATYQRIDGGTGTSLYVKESGTSNTGWRAV